MSVVYITKHDENIYNVTEKPEKKYIKPPRYISTHNSSVKKAFINVRNNQTHMTMGEPEILPKDPKQFLKKCPASKIPKKDTTQKAPIVSLLPRCTQEELDRLKGSKENFIRKNVINIKKQKFITPEPKYIDSRHGDTHVLLKSGLQLRYMINKNRFGKPPSYLLNRMLRNQFMEKKEKELSEIQSLPKCRYVTRQEREELLTGLKKNWEQLQKEYQLLPIITDTTPKVLRKVKLEKNLLQLEKDICLIEKHPYIYVDENTYSDTNTTQ